MAEELAELKTMSVEAIKRQFAAERKLSGVMSHILGGIDMWLPRVDDRTRKEMERVKEKIEEIVDG